MVAVVNITKQGKLRSATNVINIPEPDVDIVAVLLNQATSGVTQRIYLPSGMTPKGYMLIRPGMQRSTINNQSSATDKTVGFCDGTNQYCFHDRIDPESNGYECSFSQSSTTVMRRHQTSPPTGTLNQGWEHLGFGTGYIDIRTTVDTTGPYSNDYWIIVKAFGGAEIVNIKAWAEEDLGTGTSSSTISVGFAASMTYLASINDSNSFATYNDSTRSAFEDDVSGSFGIALSDGSQGSISRSATVESGSNPVAASSYLSNTKCLAGLTNETLNWTLTAGDFDSDGFDLTPSASTSNAICAGLAIEYESNTNLEIVDTTIPTSTPYTQSDVDFRPKDGMLLSAIGVTAYDTLTQATRMGDQIAVFNQQRLFCATHVWLHGIAAWDAAGQGALHTVLNAFESATSPSSPTKILNTSAYTLTATGWTFTLSTAPSAQIKGIALAKN